MRKWPDAERVLAIDPTHRGFGFVVLEGEKRLLDWGTRYASNPKRDASIEKVDRLIEQYDPSSLILEDHTGTGSRRCRRVRRLIDDLGMLGRARDLSVFSYSRGDIRLAFSVHEARTKEGIAAVLVAQFSELVPRLPPKRKVWMSEDHRMTIFDAASLALTHFHEQRQGRRTG
jgi:hypothetical protein